MSEMVNLRHLDSDEFYAATQSLFYTCDSLFATAEMNSQIQRYHKSTGDG